MKMHSLRTHLVRAFSAPTLYLCSVVYALLLTISSLGRNSVMQISNGLQFGHIVGFNMILSAVLPALAYAVTYVDDYTTRLLYVWVVRTGARRYAISYYTAALIAGFCVSLMGNCLYIIIMLLRGCPFESGSTVGSITFHTYESWYLNGWTALYIITVLMEYALGAAAMSGIAAVCSSLFHQRFSALCIPVMCFFLFDILSMVVTVFPELGWSIHPMLNPNQLTQVSSYFDTPVLNLIYKMLTAAVYFVVCGGITAYTIERSVENV